MNVASFVSLALANFHGGCMARLSERAWVYALPWRGLRSSTRAEECSNKPVKDAQPFLYPLVPRHTPGFSLLAASLASLSLT